MNTYHGSCHYGRMKFMATATIDKAVEWTEQQEAKQSLAMRLLSQSYHTSQLRQWNKPTQNLIMNKVSFFPKLVVCFIVLLVLIVLHIIPLPILEMLILYVMIFRPLWFKNLVDQLYERQYLLMIFDLFISKINISKSLHIKHNPDYFKQIMP